MNANVGAQASAPALNRQQETRISAAISAEKVQPITSVNFAVSVGTVVPGNVSLHPVPASIVSVVPEYRGYNYFLVRDEIVIVEPSSKKIVTVIQKSGASRAEAAPATTTKERVKFSDKDRDVIRRSASRPAATSGSGTRAHARTTVKVGERLPADVELESFSEEVYRDVPTVRSYRYYRGDRGIYVVDPAERMVIEEID